jgi:hypothetical protein
VTSVTTYSFYAIGRCGPGMLGHTQDMLAPTPALLPIIAISLLGIVGIVGYLARHELD